MQSIFSKALSCAVAKQFSSKTGRPVGHKTQAVVVAGAIDRAAWNNLPVACDALWLSAAAVAERFGMGKYPVSLSGEKYPRRRFNRKTVSTRQVLKAICVINLVNRNIAC